MAVEKSFADFVLQELQLSPEVLDIFEAAGIDFGGLSTISKDELEQILTGKSSTTTLWNVDEIFWRIVQWRQRHGIGIIGFAEVEIGESWEELTQESDKSADISTSKQEFIPVTTPVSTFPSEVSTADCLKLKTRSDHHRDASSSGIPVILANPAFTAAESSESLRPKSSASGVVAGDASSETTTQAGGRIKPSVQSFTPNVLEYLLKKTVTGQQILERGITGPLSNASQRELVDIIAEYHCASKITITEEKLREYADSITTLFKSELQDSYFVARGGMRKNPGGKIYNRISNRKQKAAKRKLIEERHLSKIQKTSGPLSVESSSVKEAESWLEQNSQPWATTLDKWAISFPRRSSLLSKPNAVEEVLKRYRLYSNEFGYQLLDIDFHLLSVGDSNGSKTWDSCLDKIIQYVKRPYKDDLSKDIVEALNLTELDQNAKIRGVVYKTQPHG